MSEYSVQVIKTLSLNALVCFIVLLLFVYEKKEGVIKMSGDAKQIGKSTGTKDKKNMNWQSVFLLSEIESRVRPSLRHSVAKNWHVRIRWKGFFCRNICSRKCYSYASVLYACKLLQASIMGRSGLNVEKKHFNNIAQNTFV